jgi:hypothetical protein
MAGIVTVKIQSHCDTWHRVKHVHGDTFADLGVNLSRAIGIQQFTLEIHPERASQELLALRRGTRRIDSDAWSLCMLAVGMTGTIHLKAVVADSSSPSNFVDPFWACEKTNLPQVKGIAASWFWPKALCGNTHPGPTLPYGVVSVTAYSGAYPSGYGLNLSSSGGAPGNAFGENYTCTGFTHMQASGTGSIGNYMNYIRIMPLRMSSADFLRQLTPSLDDEKVRSVLVGERAQPGAYSAVLAKSNIKAEISTAHAVALHRYTFRTSWANTQTGCERPLSSIGAPIAAPALTSIESTAPAASAGSNTCLVVDLTCVGLKIDGILGGSHTQKMLGLTATITADGRVEGTLTTPAKSKSSDSAGGSAGDSASAITSIAGMWGRPGGADDDYEITMTSKQGLTQPTMSGSVATLAFSAVSKHPVSWAKATGVLDPTALSVTIAYDNGKTDSGSVAADGSRISWVANPDPANDWVKVS